MHLNQRMQQASEKSAGVTYEEGIYAGSVSLEEIITQNANVETLAIELISIARVSGDDEFLIRTDRFVQTLPAPEEIESDADWLQQLGAFRSAAIALHERACLLLEMTTEAS